MIKYAGSSVCHFKDFTHNSLKHEIKGNSGADPEGVV